MSVFLECMTVASECVSIALDNKDEQTLNSLSSWSNPLAAGGVGPDAASQLMES